MILITYPRPNAAYQSPIINPLNSCEDWSMVNSKDVGNIKSNDILLKKQQENDMMLCLVGNVLY